MITATCHRADRFAPRAACRLAVAACVFAAGCHAVAPPSQSTLESLLSPVQTSPESVTLEIFQARIPAEQQAKADDLWQRIDELRLPTDLRRHLATNGFRVGVVSGTPPATLSELLNITDESPEESSERVITEQSAAPRVMRRVVQLRRGETTRVEAAELAAELQILITDDDGITGKSYSQVQPVYELRACAVSGQRVKIDLLPELHHGELRNRYVGSDPGIFLMTPSRERETFANLRMNVELDPSELLVMGCWEDAPGSLGHSFHTAKGSGAKERKLIVIRLLQVPRSEILAGG